MQNLNTSKYYDKLVLRKLMGITSREEDTALETWLSQDPRNRESFETLRIRWNADRQNIPEDERPRRRRVRKAVDGPEKKRSTSFYVFEGLALASLVVAAVLIFMGLRERPSIYHAGREIRTLFLPDSSKIILKPGSVLLVASNYGSDNRSVEVEGQAFVDVRPDSLKAFILITDNSRMEVTGTSFMVDSRKDLEHDDVIVLTGQLQMNALTNPEKPVVVPAGKKARFEHRAGTITVTEADTVNALAWKKQRLIFNDTPLAQVVDALEDYFGIPVQVENKEMLKCPFTRTFSEPRIDDVLKALREGLDVIVMREYGRIVIDGRNSCP
jgi:transmembrane sensor